MVLIFMKQGVTPLEVGTLNVTYKASEVCERLSDAANTEVPFESLVQAAKEPVVVAELWGQWPGDESIEELLEFGHSDEARANLHVPTSGR